MENPGGFSQFSNKANNSFNNITNTHGAISKSGSGKGDNSNNNIINNNNNIHSNIVNNINNNNIHIST